MIRLYKIIKKFKRIKNRLIWSSIKKDIKKIGKNIYIESVPTIHGPRFLEIGNNVYFGNDIRIEAWSNYKGIDYNPRIILQNNVVLTERVYISCINSVIIGEGTLIGRDVFITDNSHGETSFNSLSIPPIDRTLTSKGQVSIGKNVWIGKGVIILSGVTIGDNVVIGANSLVNKDISENSVAVGCPAKIIKRFGD